MTEYQYNVEVKSRFALFLDDSLSNEDPDLLLSRLQKKREKSKKEKVQAVQQPSVAVTKPDVPPKPEVKAEPVAPKAVLPTTPKSPKAPAVVDDDVDTVVKFDGNAVGNTVRGRGAPRPPFRGFRGARVQGPRPSAPDIPESTDEAGDQRETHYEPRGRGRARGRGVFTRDRGMHFNGRSSNQDRMSNRQFGERDDARDSQAVVTDDKVNGSDEQPIDGDHDTTEPHENNENDAPAEEEPKVYTLEEYKAMKKLTKPVIVLNTQGSRQANDGKDVFANMIAIRKVKEVPEVQVKPKEPVRQEPQPIDIVVSFTDSYNNRGRGYRDYANRVDRGSRDFTGGGYSRDDRARGGARGRGRGRGGFRDRESDDSTPAARHIPPPTLDNDVEFPSLK